MIEVYFNILLLAILFAVMVLLMIQFYNITFRGFAPFISTNGKIIRRILDEIKLSDNANVVELGCGKAPFLLAMRKKYPHAVLTGVEYSFFPYLLGQIQNSFYSAGMKLMKKNYFKVDLSDTDLVYCYLNVKSMKDLEPKFLAELKNGAQIISNSFSVPNMQPDKVIEITKNRGKIFFYRVKRQ
jgi:16S rRNA A1518/A1519 N6-dimethyltransferase RsmA/KsgA/DIM1 with predicted DNA glycosylase/AP lyase activity